MSERQLLEQLLSLPDESLIHSISLASIHPLLIQLVTCSTQRFLLHSLISRLAFLSQLDLPLLITYIKHFYPSNQSKVKNVISTAFDSNPHLERTYSQLVPKAIELELRNKQDGRGYEALETLLVSYIAGNEFIPSTPSLSSLDRVYTLLSTLPSPTPQSDQLRLTILTTLETILVSSASSSLDHLEQTLDSCLSLTSPSILLRDVERHLSISSELNKKVTGIVGDKARGVKDLIGKLRKSSEREGDDHDDEWIERIRRRQVLGGNAELVVNDAGFGHTPRDGGESQLEMNENEAEIVSAISTIQDLFPSLSTQFLRLALDHSSFKPSPSTPISEVQERLVGALLEDDLPLELKKARDSPHEMTEQPVQEVNGKGKGKEKAVESRSNENENERRNIFDQDRNFSRGTLLTKNSNQRPKAQIELDERLKESIIALAEAPSSDEDDQEEGEGEAFLEDGEDGGGGARLKVRDHGEEDDEEDVTATEGGESSSRLPSGAQTPISSASNANPFSNPVLIAHLESLYLSQPSLFSSDSSTRRSKERTKLIEQTGLDHQQLEGWKIMLERGGLDRIQKLREKQMDLGAKSNHLPPPPSTGAANQGRGGGRGGGRGRGGGGGERGRGGNARGRGDGGRAQHMRRQRGNDKKMAKMGATL